MLPSCCAMWEKIADIINGPGASLVAVWGYMRVNSHAAESGVVIRADCRR